MFYLLVCLLRLGRCREIAQGQGIGQGHSPGRFAER